MNKKFILYFSKISAITSIFIVGIILSGDFLNAQKEDNTYGNIQNYKSVENKIIANIGVAIGTNIGTNYKQTSNLPVNIYNDVMDISYILSNKLVARDKIITSNMVILNEYLNILKLDLKNYLGQSNDRSESLDSYIASLTYRYKNTLSNINSLNSQKAVLLNTYNSTNDKINSIKVKIGTDFQNFDSIKTIDNIDNYLKVKEENTYAKTYIVFIDKFIGYYTILNNYNKKLLDTLINNKEIIIKNTQIVLPDSGTDILRNMNLIYEERDWKNIK